MFGVTILGNNSALPAFGRHPTAQVVTIGGNLLLFDAGEGTQFRFAEFRIRRSRINHIFISHLHGDHYFGLAGIITSMGLLGRVPDLHVYGPPGLETIIRMQLDAAGGNHLAYPLHFHTLQGEEQLLDEKEFTVSSFQVFHRIPCWGFLVREKRVPRKFAGRKPSSYAYCADTLFNEAIASRIAGVSLVYHEATYLGELAEQARRRFHSTSVEAARIASLANADKLLLGHFSSKYESLEDFRKEAQEVFANTEIAGEGVTYLV